MLAYNMELQKWEAKCRQLGKEKAGPAPEPPPLPEFDPSQPGNVAGTTDSFALGIRDMLINGLVYSGKFIVLDRDSLGNIIGEKNFSETDHVSPETQIPDGHIESAELLLTGSLTMLAWDTSGGKIGGIISEAVKFIPIFGAQSFGSKIFQHGVYGTDITQGEVSWKTAKAAMEIRLIDTRTSRVVAATTVEGKAIGGKAGLRTETRLFYEESYLPQGFEFVKNTPIEEALHKMVISAVEYLAEKAPEAYRHQQL